MFGLEDQQRKKKVQPFIFEVEKEWKDAKKYGETKATIEAHIQSLKNALKSGEGKENFDQLGLLLHGYTSLLKVMARCLAK